MSSEPNHEFQVMIAGAGPTGLLVALRLGQAGIKTIVLERYAKLLPTTRAVVYQPVVLDVFRGYGILDDIQRMAYLNKEGIYWRTVDGKELGHLALPKDEHVLMLGQQRLNQFLLDEIEKYPSVQVRFNTAYAGCEQDEGAGQVRVMVHESSHDVEEDEYYEVEWLIAADGANSAVRRSLSVKFEGFSFTDFNMIGVDLYHDFANEYSSVMNFIVGEEDAAAAIYCGQQKDLKPYGEAPPLWRIAYLESSKLPGDKEEIAKRANERLKRYAPSLKDFEIARIEPYRMHQRAAAVASKGRVVLVGDALHSNNPIGGLGLTSGICDASAVSYALVRVCKDGEPHSLVVEAAADRRSTWLNTTNIMSQTNLQRLRIFDNDAAVKERQEFFDALANNPELPIKIRASVEKIAGSKSFAPATVVV